MNQSHDTNGDDTIGYLGDGALLGLSVGHTITSPRDPASGLATGRRAYKPLLITKELDKSTPLLY